MFSTSVDYVSGLKLKRARKYSQTETTSSAKLLQQLLAQFWLVPSRSLSNNSQAQFGSQAQANHSKARPFPIGSLDPVILSWRLQDFSANTSCSLPVNLSARKLQSKCIYIQHVWSGLLNIARNYPVYSKFVLKPMFSDHS